MSPTRRPTSPRGTAPTGKGVSHYGPHVATLFVLLLLTVVVLAMLLTSQTQRLTTQDMANICGAQVRTAVLNGVEAVTKVCRQTPETTANLVSPINASPLETDINPASENLTNSPSTPILE